MSKQINVFDYLGLLDEADNVIKQSRHRAYTLKGRTEVHMEAESKLQENKMLASAIKEEARHVMVELMQLHRGLKEITDKE